jgi:hypothetical protein
MNKVEICWKWEKAALKIYRCPYHQLQKSKSSTKAIILMHAKGNYYLFMMEKKRCLEKDLSFIVQIISH